MNTEDHSMQKDICHYFDDCEKFRSSFRQRLEQLLIVLKALRNQTEQYFSCRTYRRYDDFKRFPALKQRLIHQILRGIEDEMKVINDSVVNIEDDLNKLQVKAETIERTCQKYQFFNAGEIKSLVMEGCALQRPLDEILQFILYVQCHYTKHVKDIQRSVRELNIDNVRTVDCLLAVLQNVLNDNQSEVERILTYMQFRHVILSGKFEAINVGEV